MPASGIQLCQVLRVRRAFHGQRCLQLADQIVIDDVLKVQIVDLAGNPAGLEFQFLVFRHDMEGIESPAQATCPIFRYRQSGAQLGGIAEYTAQVRRFGQLCEAPS